MKIAQDFKYQGDDWWKWWVWIEAPDPELDLIDHVVYTLHSSFPDPVRTVKDRGNKFKLSTGGWGTFRIYAKVFPKSSPPISLHHDLVLEYPSGAPAKA